VSSRVEFSICSPWVVHTPFPAGFFFRRPKKSGNFYLPKSTTQISLSINFPEALRALYNMVHLPALAAAALLPGVPTRPDICSEDKNKKKVKSTRRGTLHHYVDRVTPELPGRAGRQPPSERRRTAGLLGCRARADVGSPRINHP